MNRLAFVVALVLLAGCSRPTQAPSGRVVEDEREVTSGETVPVDKAPLSTRRTTAVPVVVDGAVPALPEFPTPKIPIPLPPYDDSQPHPLPVETVAVDKIKQTVEEKAQGWNDPGTFHVNSLWQISTELQVASGFYDGVLTAGVVTLPLEGVPQFHAVPKVGGGGPATIVGVRDDWVLIRTGLSYVVFNYRTGESNVSDENANPGQRTVLWRPQISAEKALQIATSVHSFNVTWWVRFDPGFVYESKGVTRVRPSWIAQTLSPAPKSLLHQPFLPMGNGAGNRGS